MKKPLSAKDLYDVVYDVLYYNPNFDRIKIVSFKLENIEETLEYCAINIFMAKLGYEYIGDL